MLTVAWLSPNTDRRANVWRVLDLSGMTNSVRESRNYTLSGFVFLDGRRIKSLKDTVQLGKVFTLELRFPNGVTRSEEIMLVPKSRIVEKTPRGNNPRKLNYKG